MLYIRDVCASSVVGARARLLATYRAFGPPTCLPCCSSLCNSIVFGFSPTDDPRDGLTEDDIAACGQLCASEKTDWDEKYVYPEFLSLAFSDKGLGVARMGEGEGVCLATVYDHLLCGVIPASRFYVSIHLSIISFILPLCI